MEHFPLWSHGGNGEISYADVGAVDTGFVEPVSPETLLRETWERYRIPLAVTECHTMGHRESQLRWLKQVWDTCLKLRSEGVDIKAVTAWSLIGTYDWHNLCTNCEHFYEPGVFDLRNPEKLPKPTALSKMVKALATKGEYESPILGSAGVWNTGRRILFSVKEGQFTSLEHAEDVRPILITGATGTLDQAFARICGSRNIHYKLLNREMMDITNRNSIDSAIEKYRPWAIINAAGYVNVDQAENESEKCFASNVVGAVNLARACRHSGIKLINFSSDLVFDGNSETSYVESNTVSPLNVYGKSKADCEEQVLSIYPESLMIRTSAYFSPWDEYNFLTKTLRSLADNSEVIAPNDIFITPTYVPDLANECLNLLIDEESGIFHLSNTGEVSWEQFALLAADAVKEKMNLNKDLIKGMSAHEITWRAKRPMNSSLRSERVEHLPPLSDAIVRYANELQVPIEFKQETL